MNALTYTRVFGRPLMIGFVGAAAFWLSTIAYLGFKMSELASDGGVALQVLGIVFGEGTRTGSVRHAGLTNVGEAAALCLLLVPLCLVLLRRVRQGARP